MNWLRDLSIDTKTDRDAEIPALLEFVSNHKPQSLLDVGAHWSHAYYAQPIKEIVDRYHAIDILPDNYTAAIVDNYIVGNANKHQWDCYYEMVTCVSTLEHAGLSTYKGEPSIERQNLFATVVRLAQKAAWVSFPVGVGEVIENQLETITRDEIKVFEKIARNYDFKVKYRFFYTQGASIGHPWKEHDSIELATKIPYIDYIGNQSICVMEMTK